MNKFNGDDRITLGGIPGTVVSRFDGTIYRQGVYEVAFDDHMLLGVEDAPRVNRFNIDWFDERAELIPAPQVHPDWDSIPVGSDFGFYLPTFENPKNFPYTKLSETSYRYNNEHDGYTSDSPPPPSPDTLIPRPPKPTAKDFFDSLVPGDRFTHTKGDGEVIWRRVDYTTFIGHGEQSPDNVEGYMIQGIRHKLDQKPLDLYFLNDDVLTKID